MNIKIFFKDVKYIPGKNLKPGDILADTQSNKFYEVGKNCELRRIKDIKKIELIKSEINGQN